MIERVPLNPLNARDLVEAVPEHNPDCYIDDAGQPVGPFYKLSNLSERQYKRLKESDGHNVRIVQAEYDYFDDHEEVEPPSRLIHNNHPMDFVYSFECMKDVIHGTAASSLIKGRSFGVAPQADFRFTGAYKNAGGRSQTGLPIAVDTNYRNIVDILELLLQKIEEEKVMGPGDILSISVQLRVGTKEDPQYVPIDYYLPVRTILNAIHEQKIVVFVAAGNSFIDLDQEPIVNRNPPQNRLSYLEVVGQESKAIKVGYTGNLWHNRWSSNFGSAVSFFAPSGSVKAACFDYDHSRRSTDLIDGFSSGFGKTSAATPIVAGIAARIQSAYRNVTRGQYLQPNELVDLMLETGQDAPPSTLLTAKFPVAARAIDRIYNGEI